MRGDMRRGASLWREFEDDAVVATWLMGDAHSGQLHCRTCVRTPAVIEAAEWAKIDGGRGGRQCGGCRCRRSGGGGRDVDNEAGWTTEFENPDALRRRDSNSVGQHSLKVADLGDLPDGGERRFCLGGNNRRQIGTAADHLETRRAVENHPLPAGVAHEGSRLLSCEVP